MIDFAVQEGYDILIIDSSSHEWEGKGGCLELHQQAGGTYQAWDKITHKHNKFIQANADSPIHIIATMRGKDQYEMTKDEKGRASVQKLGIGAKQRDGFEYEFTCTFLIDQASNTATIQKDNTHIFDKEGLTILSEEHGRKIIQWANSGEGYTPIVRKNDDEKENLEEDELKSLQDAIVKRCVELGGQSNKEMMELLRSYVPNGNPKAIKQIKVAQEIIDILREKF